MLCIFSVKKEEEKKKKDDKNSLNFEATFIEWNGIVTCFFFFGYKKINWLLKYSHTYIHQYMYIHISFFIEKNKFVRHEYTDCPSKSSESKVSKQRPKSPKSFSIQLKRTCFTQWVSVGKKKKIIKLRQKIFYSLPTRPRGWIWTVG